MKTAFAALPLFAALAVATPAAAQDAAPAPSTEPVAVSTTDSMSAERPFNVRAEVTLAYDETRATYTIPGQVDEGEAGAHGLAVGFELGADARVTETLLLGVYGGVGFSGTKDCDSNVIVTTDEFCFNAKTTIRGGGRIGLLAGDNGVLYVKGGASFSKIGASYNTGATATTADRFNRNDFTTGYHFGGGAELGFGSNAYIKGEYIYERFGNIFRGRLASGEQVDPRRHLLSVGVGIRFGN